MLTEKNNSAVRRCLLHVARGFTNRYHHSTYLGWLNTRTAKFVILLLGLALVWRLASGPSLAQVNPALNTWTTETALPQALQEASVTALNGQVYLVGGSNFQGRSNATYVFDPAAHTWTTRAPYPGTARDHIGIAASTGFVYLVGGITAWPGPAVTTVQRYDPTNDTWADVAPLPLPRGAAGVAVMNRKIYVAGGLRDGAAVNDFTAYDPVTNTWETLPAMPTARDHLVAVALNGKVYAIGGRPGSNAACGPLTTVEVYNPATNTWSPGAPMITARGGHAAGTLNGRVQVFGGEGGAGCGIIASAEEYDPVSNTWSSLPSMPTPRHGTGGATIGNSIYLPGGATSTGDAPTNVHERFVQSRSAFVEQDGQVVLEAENFDGIISRSSQAWYVRTSPSGYLGSGEMVAEPDSGAAINTGFATTSPELQYRVQFTTPGTYYVWLRTLADNDNNNSIHVGLDGQPVDSADRMSTPTYGTWTWFQSTLDGPVATLTVPSAGVHTINVWMREDGFRLDRLLLTTNAATVPSGDGPAESARNDGQSPFSGTPLPIPGTIQIENFDNGGESIAYHDGDSGNTGGQYRSTDVDIEFCGDAGGGYDIGWAEAGEWLEYTVNVSTSGLYNIDVRVASPANGGTFHIEFDGLNKTGVMTVPNTGGWQAYQTITKANVSLSAGQHVMRVVMDIGGATGYIGNFNFIQVTSAAPPPAGTISFTNKVIAKSGSTLGSAYGLGNFGYPTSLELGPDGKLYVATLSGKLYILTLDQNKLTQIDQLAVTSAQLLTDIYNRQTRTCNINGDPNNCQFQAGYPTGRQVTGITIGPESTPNQIALYVSHSDPRIAQNNSSVALEIDTYSGTITKLTLQPNTATPDPNDYSVVGNQDLVVGLPRSRENHAVNGLDFGPDGWLYLSIGGHTNFGQPSAYFSNLPEYYLSAAVVRLNVNNLGGTALPLNMQGVKTAADMSPFNGKFELYATGFRNGYDIVWHSNNKLYLNDNSGNNGLGNTPGSTDGCNTPSINPPTLPDKLKLVTQNAYGGHPSPVRGQCVLNDGTSYSPPLTPLPNYVAPLLSYNGGTSTDGITEYKASTFGGKMKGNIISATYAGDQNVRRVTLNAAGTGAVEEVKLGSFGEPLDVTTDAAGIIYVAEFGVSQITLMIPVETTICNNPNSPDDDGDGYSDTDEIANGTDPCNASSRPPDFDGDFISDLNDPDDDNDGILDTADQLFFDAQNGAATALPLAFEWNPGDAPLGKVANSGFTGTQIATNGPRTNTAAISVGAAGGYLALKAFSGTAEGTENSQVNALQIGFDSSASFRIWSRLVEPFNSVTPARGHVAGIFFGPNQDNYLRLALTGANRGEQVLQVGLEQNGSFSQRATASLGTAKIINLDLFMVGDFAAKTVTAYYILNSSGTSVQIGAAVPVPAAWFSNNAGTARNTSLAGVMASYGRANPITFVYDFFRIDRTSGADLSITKTASANVVKSGNNLTYTLQVRNAGPSAASGVVITDALPAGTSFVSATTTQGSLSAPAPGASSGTLTCNVASLANGGSVTVTMTVKVTALKDASVTNTARVSASTSDPATQNNAATVTSKVN